MSKYLPIAIIVLSNIFYHVCSKSLPNSVNPFAALTVTYIVAAVCSLIIYFIFGGGNFISEFKYLNWSSWILGVAIVGLEAGAIYMYKAGWDISVGQLVHSAILAICLIVIGIIFYKEKFSFNKIAGIVICMVGLFFLNR